MATREWLGGDGVWTDPNRWAVAGTGEGGAPQPGDAATIAEGDVEVVGTGGLNGTTYDGVALTIGDAANDPAELDLSSALLGHFFTTDVAGSATIVAHGISSIADPVTDDATGSMLTLGGASSRDTLLVARGGSVSVGDGAALRLTGTIRADGDLTAASGSAVRDDADVTLNGQTTSIDGPLIGHGRVSLSDDATLDLGGRVGAGQTIAFGDEGEVLDVARPARFHGAVSGFGAGDTIDLGGVGAATAAYDAASRTLTLRDASGAAVATLADVEAASGTLTATADGAGGTLVGYADAPSPEKAQISTADRAMRSDVVRDTMTVPGTSTPITGTGVKVGIISGSFDDSSTADADAAAGYLPANPDGTSAVHIVKASTASSDDEGREMAEEVHQVAPGADLYFAAAGSGTASLAQAYQDLQAAGCQIIACDVNQPPSLPFYDVAGGLDDAVSSVVAAGTDVFVSGGNFGQSTVEENFAPRPTTLSDGTAADAQVFDDGTPYEPFTISAGTAARLDLQWTAPYEGVDGQGAPDALTLRLFSADGQPLPASFGTTTATVVDADGVPTTDLTIALPKTAATTTYEAAIYLNGDEVSPQKFKMTLSATGGQGTGAGGFFDDPDEGKGSGNERGVQLIPGVNSVGATYYANSAAFGGTPSYDEYFVNSGPGAIYDDPSGTPYPSPMTAGKLDFDAPDGVPVPDPSSSDPNVSTPFYGTSAAAPNAAAVATLMLQANPDLTTREVTAMLQESTLDQGLETKQQGAGLIQADKAVELAIAAGQETDVGAATLDPLVAYAGGGAFTLTGTATGSAEVDIGASVDGTAEDLGPATLGPGGVFTFTDQVGAHQQTALAATETNGTGAGASSTSVLSLRAGLADGAFVAREVQGSSDGGGATVVTFFRDDGSSRARILQAGQTVQSGRNETFLNDGRPNDTFVFDPGHGCGVVQGFLSGGADHDVISLPSSDFASVADVLHDTRQTSQGALITDPVTGDAVLMSGIGKGTLVANAHDLTLHG